MANWPFEMSSPPFSHAVNCKSGLDPKRHPPQVLALFDRATDSLLKLDKGKLIVVSSETGEVFVDGLGLFAP